MRRLRTASSRHLAVLVATVVALALGAVGIAQAVGGGGEPAPKPLDQAVLDAAKAPQVDGVTARIKFTNNLLPSGSLPQGAGSPIITGATGRLWLTNDGRARVELQSSAGDAQLVTDGKTFSIYDASSNTLYEGALPQHAKDTQSAAPDKPLTLDSVKQGIAELGKAWNLSGATPGNTAGQPSYTVKIAPKDDGGLLGAAELAWDAARGVPLRAAIYAQGQASPVLELAATQISYGKIAASDVTASTPKGAKVVELNPASGQDAQGKPAEVHGLDAVQKQVGFTVTAPATVAGLPRTDVRLVRVAGENGALATYGQGFGQIVVFQSKAGTSQSQRPGGMKLPSINIDGATGSELATALGTIVTFDRNGVSYVVAGSVPPVAAENAARGLK
jgi:outer membrane lipoprotein-sorting protein